MTDDAPERGPVDSASGETAGVIAPPPLLYAGGLVVGWLLHRAFPVALLPAVVARAAGVALIALSLVPAISAVRAMHRAGTPVAPSEPTTALVVTGAFRYTRNPLYLALTLLYCGLALLMNAVWPLVVLSVVLMVVTRGVIEREERYLEGRFGDAYRQYRAHVRRWI